MKSLTLSPNISSTCHGRGMSETAFACAGVWRQVHFLSPPLGIAGDSQDKHKAKKSIKSIEPENKKKRAWAGVMP